jgi:transposase-like protein
MQGKDFKGIVEQLGALSQVQREALVAVLTAKVPAQQAVAMIETRFAAAPVCGHCGSGRFAGWGRASGMKRYKCEVCSRTFNALTGTPLARLQRRDAFLAYAQALADGVTLRKAATRCRMTLGTSFRWRHRFLQQPAVTKDQALSGIVEADETLLRKSYKGQRSRLPRPARKRGGGDRSNPSTEPEHVAVVVARSRHGETSDAILADGTYRALKTALLPVIAEDTVLVSDGREDYIALADDRKIKHVRLVAKLGERVRDGIYHIQNVNAYHSRLKTWMVRFKGVATRYLASYLGWFRLIERKHEHLGPETCLAAALP